MKQSGIQPHMNQVRDRLLNMAWLYFAFFTPFALGLSISRIMQHGWLPVYGVHMGLSVVVALVAVFRKRLNHRVKGGLIVAFWVVIAAIGLPSFGLVGGGHLIMIIAAYFMAAVFGTRASLILWGAGVIYMSVVGYLVVSGFITFDFDVATYAVSYSAWLAVVVGLLMFLPVTLVVYGQAQKELQDSFARLEQSEQHYRTIFNAGSDAIFIHDGNTGEVLDVNDAMLRMYEGRREDVVGGSLVDVTAGVPPYDMAGARKKIELAKAEGPQIFEWQARKFNGELFWVEVNLRYSDIAGEKRVIAVVRDITERKRSEELIVQSEKMLSVGGLAAGIAHEINNPLSGMMQTATVLSQRLSNKEMEANVQAAKEAGTSMESVHTYMEKRGIVEMLLRIRESGQRASDIIVNMLRFARSAESEHKLENMAEIMDRTVDLAGSDYNLKNGFDFRRIRIVRDFAPELPLVSCTASKIQQVLLNLLRNGADAMQEHADRASLFQFNLRLAHDKADRMLRIEVEDNGPGMPEDVRKRIFEPFYTTKTVGEGTGLGLSVSYFIITENHGGQMHVESSPGHGTRFVIRLPLGK